MQAPTVTDIIILRGGMEDDIGRREKDGAGIVLAGCGIPGTIITMAGRFSKITS
jgi:hypothetical protein